MFLPILNYDDGYGFTYGGRFSTIGLFGGGERDVRAADWGGTRRGRRGGSNVQVRAADARRSRRFGISAAREPPLRDRRSTGHLDGQGRAQLRRPGARRRRHVAGHCRLRRASRIGSGPVGADIALDTRGDPALPAQRRPASAPAGTTLHVRGVQPNRGNRYVHRCEGLSWRDPAGSACRPRAVRHGRRAGPDLRTAAARRRLSTCAASTPERSTAIGLLTASAELRVPITSVLNGSKLGLTAFMDAGKALEVGESFRTRRRGTAASAAASS